MKRNGKEKWNNSVIDLVTSHFKTFSRDASDKVHVSKDLVTVVHKKVMMSFA